jgi:hypothetical protein
MRKGEIGEDFEYSIYQKSIKIKGISEIFYFGRDVTDSDAVLLYKLFCLGKNVRSKEIRDLLGS